MLESAIFYSAVHVVIPARGKGIAKTDLAIAVPEGCYGRIGMKFPLWFCLFILICPIAPRSGLAWKKHIDVGAGVIDADYRGNVGVVLFNHSAEDFEGVLL